MTKLKPMGRFFSSLPAKGSVLNDFNFDAKEFSQNMYLIVKEEPKKTLDTVRAINTTTLQRLKKAGSYEHDPFSLIKDDLEYINDIIFNKVIMTDYALLKEVAEYNLKLKGKNFRS